MQRCLNQRAQPPPVRSCPSNNANPALPRPNRATDAVGERPIDHAVDERHARIDHANPPLPDDAHRHRADAIDQTLPLIFELGPCEDWIVQLIDNIKRTLQPIIPKGAQVSSIQARQRAGVDVQKPIGPFAAPFAGQREPRR